MTRICALKLRGRLQFAAAKIFGRVAKSALSMVTNHAYSSNRGKLDPNTAMALKLHLHLLSHGRPRELRAAEDSCCFFTNLCQFRPRRR